MDVSIIIVNYNTAKLLEDCLYSVKEKTLDIKYEIIVIDNDSSDSSVKIVKKKFPEIHIIESKKNLGFGRANNLGAKYATGKYLFLLNSDTLLINNAVKALFDFMEDKGSDNVGACGGNLFRNDQSPNYSYTMYFPSLISIICYRSHIPYFTKNEHFNNTKRIKDVSIIIGADLFIRRNLFEKLGGFDPDFFMYVEDTDLSYRIVKEKYRVVSIPNAKIIHLQGASSSNIFKLKTEISSYIIFFRKHYNSIILKLYILIELLFLLIKSIVLILTGRKKEGAGYLSLVKLFSPYLIN